jgi:hypothetical protein
MHVKKEQEKIFITTGDLDRPGSCRKIKLTINQAKALLEVLPRMIGQRGKGKSE